MVADDEQLDQAGRPSFGTDVVRRSRCIVTRRVGPDEEIALSIAGDLVVELRGTALELWRLVELDVPIDAIVEQLADAYGVEPATIAPEVIAAVDRLVDDHVLERVGA